MRAEDCLPAGRSQSKCSVIYSQFDNQVVISMDSAMDRAGTVLALTSNAGAWSGPLGVLSDQHDDRVLVVRSPVEALGALSNAHIDLVIAEDGR
jgi:hypothetical protein